MVALQNSEFVQCTGNLCIPNVNVNLKNNIRIQMSRAREREEKTLHSDASRTEATSQVLVYANCIDNNFSKWSKFMSIEQHTLMTELC